MKVSVIICTYNPRKEYLEQVLNALKNQTLPKSDWELCLVDNNSNEDLSKIYDLSWHPKGKIVREKKPGLANARIRGFEETKGEIIVFVDDDNILQEDYLKHSISILETHKNIGSIGGKAIPEYEIPPPSWFDQIGLVGCRDLGDTPLFTSFYSQQNLKSEINEYPSCAPIGTGQVIRRKAFEVYQKEVQASKARTALGRTGKQLTSGEDNDIVLTILNNGWDVGYFPELYVRHLIPKRRVEPAYLSRLNQAMFRSWVYVLHIHNVNPWNAIPQWSVLPRKIKSYFSYQAWKGGANYIKWKGSCGMYEGLAEIYKK